jgi:CheY-like chemotaxis protein
MQMPGMDGLEATRRLRIHEHGRGARAYVVAMTANASREDRQACQAAGMDYFLTKPTRAIDLRAALERAALRLRPGAPHLESQAA